MGTGEWSFSSPVLFLATFLCFSCSKDLKDRSLTVPNATLGAAVNLTANAAGYCWDDEENGLTYDSILKPTILGARLIGTPYSVANMQQAAINLTGSGSGVSENQWYVRFKPANPDQLAIVEDLDIDLFDYPLDYELVQEGDYYDDGVTPPDQIPWLYAVVPNNFVPPAGITYELLQRMHVPTDYRFENEAFRITGNNVDTAGCTTAAASAPVANATAQNCDCSVRPSALDCDCRVTCGFSPCITSLPPVSPMRIPGGKITVDDDVLGVKVPIRKLRLVVRRFLKVERTYTDNNGDYHFTKSFRNKFTMLMKFKNGNATVSGFRGARTLQSLFPVKINMGRYRGSANNIVYNVKDNNDTRNRGAKNWAAATTHNAVQEYTYTYAPEQGIGTPPNKLKILLISGRGNGSTPMFNKRFASTLPDYMLKQFVLPPNSNYMPSYLNSLAVIFAGRIDMTIGYDRVENNVTSGNDAMAEECFHELTHAAHYNKVGNTWYGNFVQAELSEILSSLRGIYAPYGQGNTSNSPIIALGESWAYHMGHFLTNRKYGRISGPFIEQNFTYTNNNPVSDLNSNLNLLEDFNPGRSSVDPFYWIPSGLFYDLIDVRNDNSISIPRVPIVDLVSSYTNFQFFNALDNDISNLTAFKVRLLNENANRDAAGVNTIFSFYAY